MTPTTLHDEDARSRAVTDLDTTFLVEAGAGTGKTSILVQRLLAIVRSGRGQLDRLAAITFTERAAMELRARLHGELEALLARKITESERLQVREARRQFDRAQISTVHAFCANLLRERPVEARVDPDFVVLNEFDARLLRQEVWRTWLAQEMERSPAVLKQALRAEATLEHLETLRDFLVEHRDCVAWLPAPVEDRLTEFSLTFTRHIARLRACARACVDHADRAYMQIAALSDTLSRARDGARWESALWRDLPLSAKAGTRTNWKPAQALEEARRLFGEIADAQQLARAAWSHNLTVNVVAWLQGYLSAYAAQKRERGCLDFVDLLLLTRDLLKSDFTVRRALQTRLQFLLIDEFQDTDPLQAEIIFFLAERTPAAAEWTEVRLHPGKLFLVGDPQQSIYRFRRADLQVYAQVREIVSRQGQVLTLASNFRTSAPAVAWINETFTREFAAVSADQAAYRPLHASRSERTGREVIVLSAPIEAEKLSREEQRQWEARAVAAFLSRTIGEAGLEMWGGRTIGYRDVAILCRTHQTLEVYEEMLREAGVPCRVVGGRRFARRQEIGELRALLRAIDSPADAVALVATLRSSLFGFSDEELAVFACSGGRFDYSWTPPQAEANALMQRFAAAFAFLRRLHARRTQLSPAALLTELYATTHLLPLWAIAPHGNYCVAQLLQLIETARALVDRNASTLAAFNRFLALQEEAAIEGDLPVMEEQESAVRLLTIHQAKGLEFPVVILADAAYRQRRVSRAGIIERSGGQVEVRIGARDLTYTTLGWQKAEAQEQEREDAEERRLWYVAATRVRDHLVIPVVLPAGKNGKKVEHWAVPEELSVRLAVLHGKNCERADPEEQASGVYIYRLSPEALAPSLSVPQLFLRVSPDEVAVREYHAWENARQATLAAGRHDAAVTTVSSVSSLPSIDSGREGLGGLRFGRLMHIALTALQNVGQSGVPSLDTIVQSSVWNAEERKNIIRLVRETLAAPLMERARKAVERFAAAPFSFHYSGGLFEGVIDFAFIENNAWVIVNFCLDHTARQSADTDLDMARSQLHLAAMALEQLTRLPVAEITTFFVHTQQAVTRPWRETERRALRESLQATSHERGASG
ncbi:MAG TPA: UvrD-helicase domain-containing protein [Methylomirabilota bacterium]|nr:UvrD-helicase domain-containing protein [Methylomirabilota bacterium]